MLTALRLVSIVSISASLAACKPAASPQPSSTPPDTPTSSPAGANEPVPGAPGAPPRCAAEGTPWDGKPGTCFYEHGGCCYPTPEAMCGAAGCEIEHCSIMESSPAQARCTEPAPTS